jgi:hypothetical protein
MGAARSIIELVKESAVRRENQSGHRSNLFVQERIFRAGARIPLGGKYVTASWPTIMVFADDDPLAHWGHPCRYLLYDARNSKLFAEIHRHSPPYLGRERASQSFRGFHITVAAPPQTRYPVECRRALRWLTPSTGTRYALLFSGRQEAFDNFPQNDLEFLYRTLVHVYGFSSGNIQVLYFDGVLPASPYPGPGGSPREMVVTDSGTKSNFLNALVALQTTVTVNDTLLIHTTGHGSGEGVGGESVLHCYNDAGPGQVFLSASELALQLALLPAFDCFIVMMAQCYSGGFNCPLINASTATHTSVSSAAIKCSYGDDFTNFAKDWIAAMADHDPYGVAVHADANLDGQVSAKEAFDYGHSLYLCYSPDTSEPVFSSKDGDDCALGTDAGLTFDIEPVVRRILPPQDRSRAQRFRRALPKLRALDRSLGRSIDRLRANQQQQVRRILKQPSRRRVITR